MDAVLAASVVMPTHGRKQSLLRVLDALALQTARRGSFEVIVICDGDVDGSAEACRNLAATAPFSLRTIDQNNHGPAFARNAGVAAARASLIIFLDDDVVPDLHLVAAHIEAHQGKENAVTIGPLLLPPDVRLRIWAAWEEYVLCRQYDAMATGQWPASYRQFYTGNAAILKRHLIEAGGFNAAFRRAEDVELALRLHSRGLRFIFLPEARGRHYVRRAFDAWLRLPVAYGSADVCMARAGRPVVLTNAASEFTHRDRVIRILTQLCAGRPAAIGVSTRLLGLLIRIADALNLTAMGFPLCSVLFNLRYYHGLASALGGRDALQALLHGHDVRALCARTDALI